MTIGKNTDTSAYDSTLMARSPYYDDFDPEKKFLRAGNRDALICIFLVENPSVLVNEDGAVGRDARGVRITGVAAERKGRGREGSDRTWLNLRSACCSGLGSVRPSVHRDRAGVIGSATEHAEGNR